MGIHPATFADVLTYAVPALGLLRRNGGISRRPPIRPPSVPVVLAAGSSPAPTTPLTIITSVPVVQWVRADLGVTIGTGVSAWADQSPSSNSYAQAVGGKQPTLTASDATLNNQATMTFDGVSHALDCSTLTPAAPGTTPTFIWAVIQQVTWTINEILISDMTTNNCMIIQQSTATPTIRQFNAIAANANGGLAVATWGRMEAYFSASVSDYLKFITTSVTGTSAGNSTPGGGRRIGSSSTGVASNMKIAELVYCTGKPNAGELTNLDAYVTARYGAGLV